MHDLHFYVNYPFNIDFQASLYVFFHVSQHIKIGLKHDVII